MTEIDIEEREPLRWGIIGAGRIAKNAIAPAIHKSGVCRLKAVASRDGVKAERISDELHAERGYSSYSALLDDKDVDAVYIGLPNGLHQEWTIAAAEAGKHVLCEKSLTFTAEQARIMSDACRKHGVILAEAFMYRHHPQWRVVRRWISEGRIGELRAVQGHFVAALEDRGDHRYDPEMGRGCLYDLTCYPINAARFLVGSEPISVAASADWDRPGVDRSTHVTLQFEGGVMASALGSFACQFDQGVTVFGSKGRIVVHRPFVPGKESVEISLHNAQGEKIHDVPGADHFTHQIRNFAKSIYEGGVLGDPAEDGVANVTVCEAAGKSAMGCVVVKL